MIIMLIYVKDMHARITGIFGFDDDNFVHDPVVGIGSWLLVFS